MPVDGRAVRRIVVGKQHQPLPGRHAVAVQVGPDRAGQHHARHIVIAEHQGPLDSARGQNHLFGAHPVQALARAVWRGEAQVIATPLDNAQEIMIVIAEYRAARQQLDVVERPQAGHGALGPGRGRLAVDGLPVRQQAAAEFVLLIGDDHPRAGLGAGRGRREAGRPGADHQHIAMLIEGVVSVRIGRRRRLPESGRLADKMLIGHPQALRPHKGLVVKPSRREPRGQAHRAHQVNVNAGPAVDAPRRQPFVQFDLGGAQVGHGRRALAQLHNGIGLFGAVGDDAAGPAVFEAAPDDAHTVGEQRRGQGIALKALVGLAVKAETNNLGAVDAASGGQPIVRHQGAPVSAAVIRGALPMG